MIRINITDDMIERLARCEYEEDWGGGSWEEAPDGSKRLRLDISRAHLQVALDQRTGPKDRRVEYDPGFPEIRRVSSANYEWGRRKDDAPYVNLPRKSDRLKREAEARAQEIHVSHEMISEGAKAYDDHGFMFGKGSTSQGVFECVYRAMRLQEMKERGQ